MVGDVEWDIAEVMGRLDTVDLGLSADTDFAAAVAGIGNVAPAVVGDLQAASR